MSFSAPILDLQIFKQTAFDVATILQVAEDQQTQQMRLAAMRNYVRKRK
jgi:hypothetical protein